MCTRSITALASIIFLSLGAGCSSDGDSGGSPPADGGAGGGGGQSGGAAGGTGGGGAGGAPDAGGGVLPDGCSVLVEPGDGAAEALQTALIDAMSGDAVCLAAGTYELERELSVAQHQNLTLRGAGDDREAVILDFGNQASGDDGVFVTSDGFTIENVWIKNTQGNGIVVKADDSHFDNIKVTWDAGSVLENGAYAVYPTNCNRTLVENVEVAGASDAGIYVGQCREAVVRNNDVHGNVLGIEIENTIDAEVYGNEVYDNTGGVLVDLLPFKELIKESHNALVRDNVIRENNRENFGDPGTVVGAVPPGTGIMVLAADDTEIRNNTITGNDGPGVVVLSYDIISILLGDNSEDPETDRYPVRTYIHDNTFENNGQTPRGSYALVVSSLGDAGPAVLTDVLWDGVLGPDTADDAAVELCLGDVEQASFMNFHADQGFAITTDVTAHQCTLEPLPTLSL